MDELKIATTDQLKDAIHNATVFVNSIPSHYSSIAYAIVVTTRYILFAQGYYPPQVPLDLILEELNLAEFPVRFPFD